MRTFGYLGDESEAEYEASLDPDYAYAREAKEQTMQTPKTTGSHAASMTPDELRPYALAFRSKYGYVPSHEDLVTFVADQGMHVQCQFAGNTRAYTYRIEEGEPVSVGDYLQVWSPLTKRFELVRVARIGRGSWTGHTKVARRVSVAWG